MAMSKLEELLEDYCPDGVEYKKIKDCYQRLRGTPITAAKMKEIQNADGDIKIFAGGKTVINAFEKDIPKANVIRVPSVLVQSRGIIDAVYYDQPFTFKNEMWAYTSDNPLEVKFLYYVLKNNVEYFRSAASGMGSLPQISLKVTEEFEVPVPPLPVQEEIVRILDMFTELTAELTARKKQYEYYRDQILTFDSSRLKDSQIRSCTLKDICKSITSGGTPKRTIRTYYENGNIPWLRTQEVDWKPIYNTGVSITEEGLKNSSAKWIPEHCVIIAMYGATAGKSAINEIPLTTNQACCNLEINDQVALYKYVYYWVTNQYENLKGLGQGSQNNINAQTVKKFPIMLPSIEKQKEIVKLLDHFDTLCSDISDGLPAEIEAREKQYEYYRDKLLTFKRKA